MAKKAQIEPAQGCEEVLKIGDVIFVCDDEKRGHITPHWSQRTIEVGGQKSECRITYNLTWKIVPNVILSSQN
ncbi:MAG: hypothetical protein HYW15_02210 [Candidatus Giovannonibacteria bacterium]|nr:MAG: hypothetical protein HYW15_02210 [Candidatus Giovannonibacteria bacterium]